MALPETNTDPDAWAAAALAAAADLRQRVENSDVRRALTERVRAEAEQLHAGVVVAVSETAALLVPNGAALQGDGTKAVLLEGHMATGAQLVRAAFKARQQGLVIVGAIAVSADPAGVSFVRRELGAPVIVLDAS